MLGHRVGGMQRPAVARIFLAQLDLEHLVEPHRRNVDRAGPRFADRAFGTGQRREQRRGLTEVVVIDRANDQVRRQLVADDVARAQLGAQQALLAGGARSLQNGAVAGGTAANQNVIGGQYQQAAGGLGHRRVERGGELAHHRATVDVSRVGDRRAAGQRQHFAQSDADRNGDGDRMGDCAGDGQRSRGDRRCVVDGARQVDQRQHVVDRDADVLGQAGGRDAPTGRQPDGDHFVAGRIDVLEDVYPHRR